MVDHPAQLVRRAVLQQVGPDLRNQVTGHIVVAKQFQQKLFGRLQPAVGPVFLVSGARSMQQVHMRQCRQRLRKAREPEARRQQRDVERFAVEADEVAGAADPAQRMREHCRLSGKAGQEILAQFHRVAANPRQPEHEGDGAGAAGQTGGFGIDEQQAFAIRLRPASEKTQR